MDEKLNENFRNLKNFEKDRLLPRESAAYVIANSTGQIEIRKDAVDKLAEWVRPVAV